MSYAYPPGAGSAALDSATPDGATEPGSILDDAIRQIKAYLKDATASDSPVAVKAALDAAVANLTSMISGVGNRNTFAAFTSGNQAVTDGNDDVVEFDSETQDPDNVFDVSTFEFVAPANGFYFFTASLRIDQTAPSSPDGITDRLKLNVNGTPRAEVEQERGDIANGRTIDISRCLLLLATQRVSVSYHPSLSSGTSGFQVTAGETKTVFQGYRIS